MNKRTPEVALAVALESMRGTQAQLKSALSQIERAIGMAGDALVEFARAAEKLEPSARPDGGSDVG